MFCTKNIHIHAISKSFGVYGYQKYYSSNTKNWSMKSADQQLNKIAVAKWMMNICTFYSKSMARKMTSFS